MPRLPALPHPVVAALAGALVVVAAGAWWPERQVVRAYLSVATGPRHPDAGVERERLTGAASLVPLVRSSAVWEPLLGRRDGSVRVEAASVADDVLRIEVVSTDADEAEELLSSLVDVVLRHQAGESARRRRLLASVPVSGDVDAAWRVLVAGPLTLREASRIGPVERETEAAAGSRDVAAGAAFAGVFSWWWRRLRRRGP